MKKLGIAAIIVAIVFLGFTITGGICLALGIANLAVDSDLTSEIHSYVEGISSTLNSGSDYAQYSGSASFDIDENIEKIKVTGFTGDVDIVPATTAGGILTIVVEYENLPDFIGANDDAQIDFKSNGNTLTISPASDFDFDLPFFSIDAPDPGRATVYIPQYDSNVIPLDLDLTISDTVGEISVNGGIYGNITISDTVGEISLDNVTTGMLAISDTIGDVSAEGDFAGIEISDTIGECDIDCRSELTADSSIDGNIANVSIDVPASTRIDFTVAESVGSVRIDDNIIDKNSDVKFTVTGGIGDIEISVD